MRVSGKVWNALKRGGTEKREGETKILKRGEGPAVSRGGCLKKREPLQTMADLPLLVYAEICSKFYFKIQFISG